MPEQPLLLDGGGLRVALGDDEAPQGVAVLARQVDPDTGDSRDTLLAGYGVVPPQVPSDGDWTVRLN